MTLVVLATVILSNAFWKKIFISLRLISSGDVCDVEYIQNKTYVNLRIMFMFHVKAYPV